MRYILVLTLFSLWSLVASPAWAATLVITGDFYARIQLDGGFTVTCDEDCTIELSSDDEPPQSGLSEPAAEPEPEDAAPAVRE